MVRIEAFDRAWELEVDGGSVASLFLTNCKCLAAGVQLSGEIRFAIAVLSASQWCSLLLSASQ